MPIVDDRPAPPAPDRAADRGDSARRTLALRIAQRNRLRELRAERLARLRPPAALPAPDPVAAGPEAAEDAGAALEDFLRALAGDPAAAPAAAPAPAAVLHFQRPERPEPSPAPAPAADDPCDLGRLPGAGPGLVGALRRAGLTGLADLAPLAPEVLAARLGPLGRLVPAAAWIAAARAATGPAPAA